MNAEKTQEEYDIQERDRRRGPSWAEMNKATEAEKLSWERMM